MKPIIFWGGTGQALANKPIVEALGYTLIALFDDTPGLISPFQDVDIYHGWEGFDKWKKNKDLNTIGFSIAIGNPHGRIRLNLHERLVNQGLKPVSVIHPTAIIADSAVIGEGVQIMAGAIIQSEAVIGNQCIINSRALIEHEVILADAVEVQPGAVILGLTEVGSNSTIGTGVLVLSRLKIGKDVIIGAGAVVYNDIKDKEGFGQYTPRPI